jgi:hypothetical protein
LLSFFRVNDPYRILLIFLILLAIRFPYLIVGQDLTQTDLLYLAIGEALAEGKVMYRDFWEVISPLSAGTYYVTNLLFGKSALALEVLSMLLIIFQAAIFNQLLLRNKSYNENTYVPALVYVLCMNGFVSFNSLSPALLSLTFIIPTFNYLFQRIEQKTSDQIFVNTGWLLGVASLFYLPSGVFLVATCLTLVLFTNTILRRYFLLLLGYFLPIILAWVFYLWKSGEVEFINFFLLSFRYVSQRIYFDQSFILILIVPVLFFLFAIGRIISYRRYVNYQVRYIYVILFFMLFGLFSIPLVRHLSPEALVVFVPGLAFFLAHYFLLAKKKFSTEFIFIIYGLFTLYFYYQPLLDINFKAFQADYSAFLVPGSLTSKDSKKAMVISSDYSYYLDHRPVTPYVHPDLSALHLRRLEFYDNLSQIHEQITHNKPEVIIDDLDWMKDVFERIPVLKSDYKQEGKSTWVRVNN